MNRAMEAWIAYAEERGYEDAGTWSEAEMAEWADAEMAAADEIGNYEGITAEMEEWARG